MGNHEELKKNGSIIKFFGQVKDEIIVYLDSNGDLKCFSSVCPHMAGEIVRCDDGDGVWCKWHGLKFDAAGTAINGKARLTLRKYEAVIRDGGVHVIYDV